MLATVFSSMDDCHEYCEPTLVSGGVFGVKGSNPLDEGLHATLLEDAHQRGLESLAGIRWDLGDGGLGSGSLLDVAASNLLEFEVSGHIGGNEDVGELARGHEELGDEIDVPVVDTAVLLPRLFASLVVAILLEELCIGEGHRSDLHIAGHCRSGD